MKLEDSLNSTITPVNMSPSTALQRQPSARLSRQASSFHRRNHYLVQQRRQNLLATSNDFRNQHAPSTPSAPVLTGVMNEFFQATKIMEDEIMLPSRLKDMTIDEIVMDNSIQPNNWHELYTFVRDMRNQLARSRPFTDHEIENYQSEMKDPNDDEGILLTSHENTAHSSTSSIVSSEELEQSSTSSNMASFDTIRDELKYFYFGLLGSLDNLTMMAHRVTERYRDDSTLKNSK